MGFEILVSQRSDEWFKLRNSVSLTASQFGDALGVGRGLPIHFLQSIITESDDKLSELQKVHITYTLLSVVLLFVFSNILIIVMFCRNIFIMV